MANKTIIAVNKTISDITIVDLGSIIIPASGQLDLTDIVSIREVRESSDFNNYVDIGDIVVNDGTIELTTSESINFLTPIAIGSSTDPSTDIANNTTKRHDELHTILSHSDTSATGTELNTLTDGSNASSLHYHTFGSEFQEISDDTESSTTSTAFQQKLRLTTTSLPSGKYRIGWYNETRQSSIADSVEFQIELDDTTILANGEEEPKDTKNIMPNSGFVIKDLSGVHTIDMDYRQQGGNTAYIQRARIELWRVS